MMIEQILSKFKTGLNNMHVISWEPGIYDPRHLFRKNRQFVLRERKKSDGSVNNKLEC